MSTRYATAVYRWLALVLLAAGLRQLAELRVEVLEKHLSGAVPGDQQFGLLLSRVESLQQALPALMTKERLRIAPAQPERKAA